MSRYRFSTFEVDLGLRELRRNGCRVSLQPQPFVILASLLEAGGEVVTREDLIRAVWGEAHLADPGHSLNIAMRKLRTALDDSAEEPRLIGTVPRQGYRLLVEVERVESEAGATVETKLPARATPGRWSWATLAALAFVTIPAILWLWFPLRARTLAFRGEDGTGDRIVYSSLDAHHPRPSRDGRFIAYLCGQAVCRLDVETGAVRTVVPTPATLEGQNFRPLPSPDGQWIAYSYISNATDHADLRAVRSDGSQDRVLLAGDQAQGEYFSPVDWTADGESLLVARVSKAGTGLLLVPFPAGGIKEIARPDLEWFHGRDHVKISPDGKWIAYPSVKEEERRFGHSPTDVKVMPAGGGESWTVMSGKGVERVIGWLPGGDLLVQSDRMGVDRAFRVPLLHGKPGGEPEILDEMAGWNITGSSIATGALYLTRADETSDLYAHTPGGAAPRRLTVGFEGRNRHPIVSPDGKTLVYAVNVSQSDSVLVVHDLQSGKEHRLPHRLTWVRSLHWFPDNRAILVVTFSGEFQTMTMCRVDTATGDLKTYPVVRETEGAQASPSPQADGRSVIYLGGKPRAIRLLDLETMASKKLITSEGGYLIWRPVVSPNGQTVAYVERDDTTQHSRLVVRSLKAGAEPRILDQCQAGACRLETGLFTRDGGEVIFYRSEGNSPLLSLYAVPVAGGAVRPYLRSNIPIGHPTFSPLTGEIIASSSRFTGQFRVVPFPGLMSRLATSDAKAQPQRTLLGILSSPLEAFR